MTHPLKTRNAHFSKTLTTFALLTGLLVACGDGASMPDNVTHDEGGTTGTDQGTGASTGTGGTTATGTGGSDNGSGGTPTTTATGGTGGTTPDGTGGTVATGGSAATGGTTTGGTPGTGGAVSTGGTPATGGTGGTVSSEVPKLKAELTKEDYIYENIYVVVKDEVDQKLKIARTFPASNGGFPGCKGTFDASYHSFTIHITGVLVRPATIQDFGKYPNPRFDNTGLVNQEQIWENYRQFVSNGIFQQAWDRAVEMDKQGKSGMCPNFPKE